MKELMCIKCGGDIEEWTCQKCGKKYQPYKMLDETGEGFKEESGDVLINKLKVFFKNYPFVFNFFFYVVGASLVGKSPKKAIENKSGLILNLGSGIRRIRKDVINIDFYPFKNVDLVADLYKLPFKDNSVDAIINEFVLEHVKEPEKVIKEIYRVLKPEGLAYITVPFLTSFHSSPDDYYRWTKNGLREMMKDFKEEEMGTRSGPTSALISTATGWLATILSFGSKQLYQIILMLLMIATCPLKLIDFLIYKMPNADNSALGFYFIGKK